MSILSRFLGDSNEKVLKEIRSVIDQINGLEEKMKSLSDEELQNQTAKLKEELKNGKTPDDILPEAFATVREAAGRVIGQRHYDVQLISGLSLHRGHISEMKTGEGKTLAATAPLYLNALTGRGVHLITVNDYLARIHADWMGRIYDFLGLSTGCIGQQTISYKFNKNKKVAEGDDILDVQYLETCSRKEAYACDILYGTNNEFGFDYLRDNMVPTEEEKTQRGLHYAIVDEVDSILIDEARTPLIISAPDMESTDKYYQFSKIVLKLAEGPDYNIDEKMRAVTLTDEGIEKIEKILGVDNIYTDRGIRDVHHIEQALKAHAIFKKDRDYVVKDGEIVIIDEFTGRMMFGRRYSEGLHQAIEAKENVPVQKESVTLATISFQNYFRIYEKLAGMTGTAATEAEEFSKIYKLEVVVVPTNKSTVRKDLNDKIYKNEHGKYQALVEEVKIRHKKGQPILIGTISIEKNEIIADLLEREGIPAQTLNAKHHEKEAHIIAQAGKLGAVTVATNMAGRGVDIILGGHPFNGEEYKQVVATGGLCVFGTERHESRRIDNQLRGRSGRQGDPGVSQFFLSMDDDLMRIFGSSRMKSLMNTLGLPDNVPIENKIISRSIEQAQKRVEGNNFDIRKHLVEYDDVMNKHRETIYKKRNQILESGNQADSQEVDRLSTKTLVLDAIFNEIDSVVNFHTQSNLKSEWDLNEIYQSVNSIFPVVPEMRKNLEDIKNEAGTSTEDDMSREKIAGYIKKMAVLRYDELERSMNMLPQGESELEPMRQIEKSLLLRTIDTIWIEHLDTMQNLRTGIGLRGYGQRDPLIEYKRESIRLFRQLLSEIDKQVAYSIFKIGLINPSQMTGLETPQSNLQFSAPSKESMAKSPMEADAGIQERKADKIIADKSHFDGDKVGRNDPCPCGSGKKFKKCHGR
ncbi:MAG: preprotein translocase subunit SecA [Candidatus Buchananbacteria bacterium]|nr:preprotein translocase subunit SecA [Candidatus Buchananbacteria bacterium]